MTETISRSRRAFVRGTCGLCLLTACGTAGGDDEADDALAGDGTTGDDGEPPDCGSAKTAWAHGGTAAMTDVACYPDPFAAAVGTCALLCEADPGPCTAETSERRDVSEGLPGLPVRLALRVVASDGCAPIPGARVEIWHTQRSGVYSGVTPLPTCHGDDDDAVDRTWFRGVQVTDEAGVVYFDTCFPGWYEGRSVHIHLDIARGDDVHATTQLFFAQALIDEIFAGHPDYVELGRPDTTNADDFVFADLPDPACAVLDTARMPDGVMLASKTLALPG